MLLTLNTPLDPAAVRFAIETALETGAELLVCDAVPLAVGLLVFGADRRRLGRWRFRMAVRRLRRDVTCLVWLNE